MTATAELDNRDTLLDMLRQHNVILLLSGHLHRHLVFKWDGMDCVEIGHNRDHPVDIPFHRCFAVAHITDERLTVVPWHWGERRWGAFKGWPPEASFSLDRRLG